MCELLDVLCALTLTPCSYIFAGYELVDKHIRMSSENTEKKRFKGTRVRFQQGELASLREKNKAVPPRGQAQGEMGYRDKPDASIDIEATGSPY